MAQSTRFDLWVPDPSADAACALQRVRLSALVELRFDLEAPTLHIWGAITRPNANAIMVSTPDGVVSLTAWFQAVDFEPTLDANDDGVPESWEFTFEGPAVEMGVPDGLVADPDRSPCD